MALLEVENLGVAFQTRQGLFRAVDGISMSVDSGDLLGIVGESGSGKSVTMLALMGLLPWTARITAERMLFDGKDMLNIAPRERRRIIGKDIAMVFQEPMTSLNPCFTVGFQIMEMLKTHEGGSRAERKQRTIELLDLVGIPAPETRLSAFPHQLSGGMSQRVMIAMAISCNPRLLIADEPTTALDVTIQAQILDLLLRLQRERGMTLILITHDMGVVAETVNKVMVMYAGQQMEVQPAAALFSAPVHPYTAALLDALPERSDSRRLSTISGAVPGMDDRPSGCLFSPRCRFMDDLCWKVRPDLSLLKPDCLVRCHTPLQNGMPVPFAQQVEKP